MNSEKLIFSKKKYGGQTAVVSARLPIELVNRIDKITSTTGKTRNEVIQTCLEFSLDNVEIETKNN